MRLWYGSGSADSCLRPMDPATDPAIFVLDFQDANKKKSFLLSFSANNFFEGPKHYFSKIKSYKEVTKQ